MSGHSPLVQLAVCTSGMLVHAKPQAPQLAAFVVRSTHTPLQHELPVGQTLPQSPQLQGARTIINGL
jgi:hypothetical protein